MSIEALRTRLPSTWMVKVLDAESPRGYRPDATIQISDPNSTTCLLVLEAKSSLEARDIPSIVRKLQQLAGDHLNTKLFVTAPFLGPLARRRLIEEGVGYADKTGNLRLVLEQPAVFIEIAGQDRNPWPDQTPLRSLRGRAAGRAARAFCDFAPPYGIGQLANASHTSAPSLSRVADLLEREGVLARAAVRGRIVSVDWRGVLRRWSQDYSFMGSNETSTFLEPRGLRSLTKRLQESQLRYAVTGSIAAATIAPLVEPRLAMIYVPDVDEAAAELGLRSVESGANVVLARPFNSIVFDRFRMNQGLVFAAPSQIAVDLMTGTGRNPAEAEAVISWMASTEGSWRTPISTS